jgi:hypothetical protein
MIFLGAWRFELATIETVLYYTKLDFIAIRSNEDQDLVVISEYRHKRLPCFRVKLREENNMRAGRCAEPTLSMP